MPITRSARFVTAASTVIEIEDVLLARIAAGRLHRRVGRLEHLRLHVEVLGDRFDAEVDLAEHAHVLRGCEP
jgi:hypothetical protein